jgi:hypothetical protein
LSSVFHCGLGLADGDALAGPDTVVEVGWAESVEGLALLLRADSDTVASMAAAERTM